MSDDVQRQMQEIFDKSATHLLRQGRKSLGFARDDSQSKTCLYRGNDGCKCAAGVFIPDEEYDRTMEGVRWGTWLSNPESTDSLGMRRLRPIIIRHGHIKLISKLQDIHDTREPCEWRTHLAALAKNLGLSTAAIDAIPHRRDEWNAQ